MYIPFSPPDMTEKEAKLAYETILSGWITSGPKKVEFEEKISQYCGTEKTCTFNSATAALELALRFIGVEAGDEVIVPAYTYTASCSVICHVGATPVMVDCKKDSFEMDYDKMEEAINEKTKVIIPVDLGGVVCDYDKIFEIVEAKKNLFTPNNDYQKALGRVMVLADSAHGFGAEYKGKKSLEEMQDAMIDALKACRIDISNCLTLRHILQMISLPLSRMQHLTLHRRVNSIILTLRINGMKYH